MMSAVIELTDAVSPADELWEMANYLEYVNALLAQIERALREKRGKKP